MVMRLKLKYPVVLALCSHENNSSNVIAVQPKVDIESQF
jgi:hypothetical protein